MQLNLRLVISLGSGRSFASAAQDGRGINSESLEGAGWSEQDREIVDASSPAAKPKIQTLRRLAMNLCNRRSALQQPEAVDVTWIELSEFVNLREGPSSSERVIGVMEKGSKLRPIARKRGWVKVTNVATSKTGWIYARYAASATKSRRISQKAVPSRLGPGPDDSFWTRLGQWGLWPIVCFQLQ